MDFGFKGLKKKSNPSIQIEGTNVSPPQFFLGGVVYGTRSAQYARPDCKQSGGKSEYSTLSTNYKSTLVFLLSTFLNR
ncbi:hypothetical protein BVC80_1777g25 [Macleaya cordata]|uniref:Uncharacterized protein n=1 Tax=Macleaya cordata TaxID=56857 RepID=A0A200QP14_MACCD|nr:hypothetical protein BVC80_1777g25 [Macleaya cordata]